MEQLVETKTCTRCGVEQSLENFRKYYNGGNKHYTFCRTCERIEMRRKYILTLDSKGKASPKHLEELCRINKLYDIRSAKGLDVPGRSKRSRAAETVLDVVERELSALGE